MLTTSLRILLEYEISINPFSSNLLRTLKNFARWSLSILIVYNVKSDCDEGEN